MIKDDDFDSTSIEVTTERLVVWTAAGTREVTLPHTMITTPMSIRGTVCYSNEDGRVPFQ